MVRPAKLVTIMRVTRVCDRAEGGYPVANEEEYYQQRDPDGGNGEVTGNSTAVARRRARSPSVDSQSKSKPMPKGSSFFIFSSKNRLGRDGD